MDSVKLKIANIINAQSNSLNEECQEQILTEERLSLIEKGVNENKEADIRNMINQRINTTDN